MIERRVLVVDDEPGARMVLERSLTRGQYEVVTAEGGDQALDLFREQPFPVVVTDINMPGMSGFELLDEVRKHKPDSAVLMITAYADLNSAVEALRRGADDYIIKPIKPDLIVKAVDRVFEKLLLSDEVRYLRSQIRDQWGFENIVGTSEALKRSIRMALRVSPSDETILISGGSGTGKELFARAIHLSSPRRQKRFIAVNCGALPEQLIESELFGHRKGAFTSAVANKEGLVMEANGGTVFFDEVSELPTPMQVKFLRFLQDHFVRPVGALKEVHADVRVLAATNKDLQAEVDSGRFREDLYFRLRVLELHVPSLRDRREDIPVLVRYFIKKHGERSGRDELAVPDEIMELLINYDWPGNAREVENLVKHLLIMCEGTEVTRDDLPAFLALGTSSGDVGARDMAYLAQGRSYSEIRSKVLEDFNRQIITEALELEGWNISRAAERLGTAKSNVIRLMKRFGLTRDDLVP